jgi:hypothetical protein
MKIVRAVAVLAALTATSASASIIEIAVTGVIVESYDTGVSGGAGAGFADGKEAVLTLRYDTASAPPDLYGGSDPTNSRYESCGLPGASWLGSTLSVDGAAVAGILGNGTFENCDWMDRQVDAANGYLTALDSADNSFADASRVLQEFSRIELQLAAPGDWLSLSLDSVFSIEPTCCFFSVHLLQYAFDIDAEGNSSNERGYDVFYRALPMSAVARQLDVNQVPEPSTALLLGPALLVLFALRARTGRMRHGRAA